MKRDTCPICRKPVDAAFTPFCSRGCKDRDLLQWLGEGYRIPAGPADEEAQTGLDTANDAD
ncbi:DNA gyrase inhibitor YacG [Sphingomonas sp. AOB5]|uniref:DNA gyrase inhibitor YacG n=1 Tax=Sphingomonas sp. AOB5 TaxID=3034017 RepID=UPI0023FA1D4C|nr:DNA gyrase inhibitor YacG [Sphingomonas sp. AOB5]MDF7773618.1 DNA gyrase inhibitor YacG [Sphingomonas sp. AOB5]